jgi:hypothetical protein
MSQALPRLAVNGRLIRDLMAAPAPCCAIGMVEVENRLRAFLALRTAEPVPADVTAFGFNFDHGLVG